MSYIDGMQVQVHPIECTEEHLRGFAHKHPLEMSEYSLEKLPPGSSHTYLATWLIRREMHSFQADDIGAVVIDITSIKKLLATQRIRPVMIRMDLHQEWVDHTFTSCGCEEDHIQRLTLEDLRRPGIMMDWGYRRTCQIDGNHRLVRSWREGIRTYEMAVVKIIDVVQHVVRPGNEEALFDEARKIMTL